MKQTLFIRQLGNYFDTHLPQVKKCSPNTIASYADSFALLFQFFQEEKGKPHYLINYKDFTPATFDDFLIWLGKKRNYSAVSMKHRMSSITSFFKYASRRDMAALNAFSNASSTEKPRVSQSPFPYFSLEEIKVLLRLPNPEKKNGRRDLALLSLLYESAARAQELCDLCIGDIRFGSPTKVKLHGKGSKVREIPISDDVSSLLKYHLRMTGMNDSDCRWKPLFSSQTREKMTPACIRSITDKYVGLAKSVCPNLFCEPKYSPHSFRHSKAVHMVESGTALIYIRNFLGHSTVQSTEKYARIGYVAITKALTERNIPKLAPNSEPDAIEIKSLPDFISLRRKNYVR